MTHRGSALVLVVLLGLGVAGTLTPSDLAPPAAPAPAAPAELVSTATGAVGAATSRLSGPDRYTTAVAISRHTFTDPARVSTVYLANGDVSVTALVAGTLRGGPVLLVRPDCRAVPSVVLEEVRRLDPARVTAVGGTASVCDATLAAVAGGRPTARLGTDSTHTTAARVAAHAFPGGSARVYLTRNAVTADAVAAGMLHDGPILLTSRDGTEVPPRTLEAIAALGATRVVALGGPATVTDAALAQAADGRSTGRLAGSDRYTTAVAIAKHAYPDETGRVYLARGDGTSFPDALVSGMLTDGPVALTPGTCEPVRRSTAAFLKQRHPARVVAVGGPSSLCVSTLRGASLAARPTIDCAVTTCVALTYDDGPSASTATLLDTLASHRIPATFFQVGQQVDGRPAPSRRAHVEGHQVGNHTWDHKQLTTLTRAQQQWEVDVTDNELNQHGVPDTTLLRPPYGSYDTATRQLGFPLVLWDVDPRDWDGPPSSATVRSRVVSAVRPGSIVLMHDLYSTTVAAAPGIVSDLKAAGYTFVSVSELVPRARPGDIVYNRTRITTSGTVASTDDVIVLEDGRRLGPVVDEAPVPGIAPRADVEEILRPRP